MATTFRPNEAINERSAAQYQTTFREAAAGQPQLNGAAITAIVCTLRDVQTNTVINGRNAQSVLNTNGGTVAGDGTFTLHLTGATDNILVSPTNTGSGQHEKHRLTFVVTYNKTGGGSDQLTHEVFFYVVGLKDVTN